MTRSDPAADLESLKADLAALRDDLASLSKSFLGQGADSARAAKSAVEERVGRAADSIEQFVEERPFTTVLIAFGAGMLAASILRRR
ncbi:MAG: hypothetical protein U0575_13295 [Phycisphaerales bacterium]